MPDKRVAGPTGLKAIWRRLFGTSQSQDGIDLARPATSSTGKSVSINNAMELSTVWGCVRLLSEAVGTLPLMLYRTTPGGERQLARDEPLFEILHSAPNYDLTAVEMWEGVTLSLCLPGNHYSRKRMMGQRLVALEPLRSDWMEVRRNDRGARVYRYHAPTGLEVLSEDEVFHVRGFGGHGDVGLSPIAFARQSLGSAMAAEEFAGSVFRNGARPSGVFTMNQILTADQRADVKKNIVDPYSGADMAGAVMVLEGGMKFEPISMTLEDAQFLQTRSFSVEEICRWFRVPPFMVGHTEKTTSWGTGLEQQMIGFMAFSLRPYLVRIEQSINRSLIPAAQRGQLTAEFSVEGLLRADSKARAEFYGRMVRTGIMTRNEARRLENLPPKEGGDVLTVQAQDVPIGSDAAINGGKPASGG